MISKRQYFSILLIFAAVFLLFMGTQAGKSYWGRDQENRHVVETGLRSETQWTGDSPLSELPSDRPHRVLYVGDSKEPEAAAAAQWAEYAKLSLEFAPALPEDGDLPDLVLLRGEGLDVPRLEELMDRGINLVCLTMPSLEELQANTALRELLGIYAIHRDHVTLQGMHLFSGFLLGGERIYAPADREEEEKRQDLDLETPWYIVRPETETYMQGILSDEDAEAAKAQGLKNEDNPAILWRRHRGTGELFVVNGSFMSNRAIAAGILHGIMAQIQDVWIYPVLDAQLFSLVDFPALSDENSAVMQSIYGREMTDVTRNIILPSLVSLPNRYGVTVTAFAMPQYDTGAVPQQEMAAIARQAFQELDGELALSLKHRPDATLAQTLEQYEDCFSDPDAAFEFSAVYADSAELEELDALAAAHTPLLKDLRTVLAPASDLPPLGYLNDNVTLQRMTGSALTHTYIQDLELLGWETSLGYDNCCYDVSAIWRPETEEDMWQIRSEQVYSNLLTYRKPFAAFAHVTASECDAKIRRFLQLDCACLREGDEITLLADPFITEASFVLRLHGETIASMEGGDWTELEDGACLLRITQGYVTIQVTPVSPLKELDDCLR